MKQIILSLATSLALSVAAFAQEPVWDGNKVILESQEIGDGVFAVMQIGAAEMAEKGIPLATSSGFVIGDNGVLVVDSMLNERLHKQLVELIKAQTSQPISYMVNTSAHGDHSYGNQFVPNGAQIIQHANAANYIENHFEADTQFMIQNFGAGRGIEEITPTKADILVGSGGDITIDLGGRKVSIKDFGFAQTGGDLFVSVPSANVLWTGNAIVAQPPALPWLLDGHLVATRDTLQIVHDVFDADTKVVPGHGPVTDIETIAWNVSYLNAVETEVKAAVADKLTLEETVAKVQLSEYGGYALFGWVHPGLNIPAAYKDLQK